jgi:hypothetical protein
MLSRLVRRWALVMVAAVFLLRGAGRIAAWDYTVPSFAVWGYPAWLAGLLVMAEVLGALLVLMTPWRRGGAILLGLGAGFLVVTHIVFADGWRALAPDLMLLAALTLAVALRARSPQGPARAARR